MRDVVVSTRPLSYRSAGSIRSLPTTCTHEARRGRGSYTTGREILSPLHPPTSLSLTRPLLSLSPSLWYLFLLQPAFSPHSSKEPKGRGRLPPPLRRNRGEQAPKFVATLLFVDASKREPSRSRLSLFQDCPPITLGIRGPTRSFGWKF